ncbi:MAG: hypothetical protein RL614_672 [Pseudomonadota bacterium]|jgi:hypothetical protein
MSMIEEWRPIAGYEGVYEVSNLGRVRSLDRLVRANSGWRRTGVRYFNPSNSGKNKKYKRVLLRNPDKQRPVHHLVLEAFIGPRPENCEARHLDGDPSNNRLDNLAWGTKAENEADKIKHGTLLCGTANPASKLTEADVLAIRASNKRQVDLAALYGVSQPIISAIRLRKIWKHVD